MSLHLLQTVEAHHWRHMEWRPGGRHEDAHKPVELSADALASQLDALRPPARRLLGADTIASALGLLPAGLDTYSSYVDNFGGWNELLGMRGRLNPEAVYFSYTIFGQRAHCADVEPGAMHPSDLPGWLRARAIGLPGALEPAMVYYSAGIANEVEAAAAGIPYIKFSAHYDAGPHICEPDVCGFPFAHGTQWADAGPAGQNYDRELWRPGILGGAAPPRPPTPPEGSVSIALVRKANGLLEAHVHCQDGSVKHTWQNADHNWHGEQFDKDGKLTHEAVWEPLGNPGK